MPPHLTPLTLRRDPSPGLHDLRQAVDEHLHAGLGDPVQERLLEGLPPADSPRRSRRFRTFGARLAVKLCLGAATHTVANLLAYV